MAASAMHHRGAQLAPARRCGAGKGAAAGGARAVAAGSCKPRRVSQRAVASAQAEPSLETAAAPLGRSPPGDVSVLIEKPSFSSRRLVACTSILAPPEAVWAALTDYDGLGNFIPSLVENRCLERREQGAVLYQVGAQDVAMGVKFRAACTLEITEHPAGVPAHMCVPADAQAAPVSGSESDGGSGGSSGSGAESSGGAGPLAGLGGLGSFASLSSFGSFGSSTSGSSSGGGAASGGGGGAATSSSGRAPYATLFPWPTGTLPGQPVHGDITFDLVEGDFQSFKGVWRIQPGLLGPESSWLVYALFVKPQAWLPVGLIQDRISREVVSNLQAVQRHSEASHRLRRSGAAAATA